MFSVDNISIVAAIGNLGWGAATVMAKMPELALLGGGVTLSAAGVWQAVKSKWGKKEKDSGDNT